MKGNYDGFKALFHVTVKNKPGCMSLEHGTIKTTRNS